MKFIQADGGIWRLSERSFAKLQRDLRTDKYPDLNHYGKVVVPWFENLSGLQEQAEFEKEGTY